MHYEKTRYNVLWRTSTQSKAKMFVHWIQHIKTMGDHSLSIIYIKPAKRKWLIAIFYKHKNHGYTMTNTDRIQTSTQSKDKKLWQLDSTHQNHGKPLSFSNLLVAHKKIIPK